MLGRVKTGGGMKLKFGRGVGACLNLYRIGPFYNPDTYIKLLRLFP